MKFEHQLLHSGKFTAFLISVGVVNAFVKQQKGTNRMIVIIHILGVTGTTTVLTAPYIGSSKAELTVGTNTSKL